MGPTGRRATVDGAAVSTTALSVGTVAVGVTGDVLVGPATVASSGDVRAVLVELTLESASEQLAVNAAQARSLGTRRRVTWSGPS